MLTTSQSHQAPKGKDPTPPMAGIFERLSTVFRSKANKALDKIEDPRETLDYSYQRQLDMLREVADVL